MIVDTARLAVLETERLRLEPLTEADAADLYPLMDDPEAIAFRESPDIGDVEMVGEMVRTEVAQMRRGEAIHWSVRRLADGALLGCCDLSEIDRRRKRADIGFLLGRAAWDDSFAREGLQAVVAFAAASGLRRLQARVPLGVRRAEALLEALGFRDEGLLRGQVVRDGERRDGRLFGLLL
jgi:ribosomal-protein-alanine N-acetyltransferase